MFIFVFGNLFSSFWRRFNEPLAHIFNFIVMKPNNVLTVETVIVLLVQVLLCYSYFTNCPSFSILDSSDDVVNAILSPIGNSCLTYSKVRLSYQYNQEFHRG